MRQSAEATAPDPTYAELQHELPPLSARALRYRLAAAGSRAGALLSDGLRIGYAHGFDSGQFMAHVYANEPRGHTALGRLIDRRLLSCGTCEAFREIRVLGRRALEQALRAADTDTPVVADLAAGPAPYLFEVLAEHPGASAIIGDIDPSVLDLARARAAALGMSKRVRFVQASAFDRAALAALEPTPDVVVELGLYGIYPDDKLIERHFQDLADTVGTSQIVFNVQTRNPEIEHIARVWRDHRGERCVWRLRPAESILRWAAQAGYEQASLEADRHRIYRVGRLARATA